MRKLLLLLLFTGCAEDLPGQAPPLDQLHYPIGLRVDDGRLFVVNSNFDLRYQAGSLLSMSVEGAYALASQSTVDLPVDRLPDGTSGVRIPSLAGEMVLARGAEDERLLVVASRGKNLVSVAEVDAAGGVSCATPNVEPILGIDCTRGFVLETNGIDPFSLVALDRPRTVAIGHLRSDESHEPIALLDLGAFKARRLAESTGGALPNAISTSTSSELLGVGGLASIDEPDGSSILLAAGRYSEAAPVSAYRVKSSGLSVELEEISRLSVGAITGAIDLRGLILSADRTRAYVSMRILQRSTSTGAEPTRYNSAVAVVSIVDGELSLVAAIEVGEELGSPALIERGGRRFLLAPDLRTSVIYVLDASSDVLAVAAKLTGFRTRESGGELIEVGWLSVPAGIAVAEVSSVSKTVAFVSNFGNSTLAVLDVTGEDPAKFAIVGRIGRVLRPDGSSEE
ncbi:MAG: hypothetical protein HY791_28750 [Deltaproteobacteria bacterium]|nr:hypothetical protein [Deltaproteobacteria bacterium]